MNLAALISSFNTGTYTVTRKTRGTPSRGIVPTTSTTLTINASVSPARGMDLVRAMEGRKANGAMTIFTMTELFVGGAGLAQEADVITINGIDWEVSNVEKWTDSVSGASAYKCTAVDI